jgi:hypothetical protein
MTPSDKINLCRRAEISGYMTGQAQNKTGQAENHMYRDFFCRKVRGYNYARSGIFFYRHDKQIADR